MYKVLVVDDESRVRDRLKYTIDWEDIGIQAVLEASNGKEALQKSIKELPDVVITDIRMPGLDGLEFIKRLWDSGNKPKVIIISGYDDFEYAQQAVRLGACDYVLKPIDENELIAIVIRCLKELDEESKKSKMYRELEQKLKESIPLFREKFLQKLIEAKFDNSEEILKEIAYLNLGLTGSNIICFVTELDDIADRATNTKGMDKRLLEYAVYNIINELIVKLDGSVCFTGYDHEIIAIISSGEEEHKFTKKVLLISSEIRKTVKEVTGNSVTIGVGRSYNCLMDAAVSYKEAKEALKYKAYLGKDNIYDIKNVDISVTTPNYRLFKDIEALINYIKLSDKDNALRCLKILINEIGSDKINLYPINLKFIYMDIINSIFKATLDLKSVSKEFSELSLTSIEKLNKIQGLEEVSLWLKETIEKIIETIIENKDIRKRKVVEKAIRYVQEHYAEQVTLNQMAEMLFLSPPYFCKIFTEENGDSFIKYLMKFRIQKAKVLLKDPTVRIYEIAEKVGYEDTRYFTKIFKAFEGITPVQYRERIK